MKKDKNAKIICDSRKIREIKKILLNKHSKNYALLETIQNRKKNRSFKLDNFKSDQKPQI